MNAGPAISASRFPIALFLLGIALRLPGLLFNGMADVYQILLEWGAAVHHLGLVDAFGINYGILSYAAFGVAEAAAEWMPRFWWAPYKLLVIAFDAGACLSLLTLVEPRDRRWLLVLVWLNPWFVLHGAYYGFWEGPHLLFGLLAVTALRDENSVNQIMDAGADGHLGKPFAIGELREKIAALTGVVSSAAASEAEKKA